MTYTDALISLHRDTQEKLDRSLAEKPNDKQTALVLRTRLNAIQDCINAALSEHGESPPAGGGGEVEYEFEVWQDDAMMASVSCTDYATAKSEVDHYALMYGQDGPVEVRLYEKRRITAPPTGKRQPLIRFRHGDPFTGKLSSPAPAAEQGCPGCICRRRSACPAGR